MKTQAQIDATLRLIGSAVPPAGLKGRIHARLAAGRGRGFTAIHCISIAALAASMAVAMIALSPALRGLAKRNLPLYSGWTSAPRVMMRPAGSFGTASAAHVPPAPIPVAPTPVTQGRGHTRSGRGVLLGGAQTPLPHGVAVPQQFHVPPAAASSQHVPVSGKP